MSDQEQGQKHDPWTDNPQQAPASQKSDPASVEARAVHAIAREALAEQRRNRRWGIVFKSLFFVYLIAILLIYNPSQWGDGIGETGKADRYTAIVELKGVISSESDASADKIVTGLRAAFKDKKTAGVILRINSPGGSPVQSGYINDEIVRLRKEYPETPLYAVVTDICASGGYYVAAAADKIYADKASVVGSIGVLMDGFGFTEAMEKLGVERRLYTAGESKGFLDPFSPQKKSDLEHAKSLLGGIHQQFIDAVKSGRGDRLKDDPKLFSGLVWTGEDALALGLIDDLGSASYVAREVIGVKEMRDFTPKPDYWERITRGIGTAIADRVIEMTNLHGLPR